MGTVYQYYTVYQWARPSAMQTGRTIQYPPLCHPVRVLHPALAYAHSRRTGALTNHDHGHIAAHDVEAHHGHCDQEEVEESVVSLRYTVANLERVGIM